MASFHGRQGKGYGLSLIHGLLELDKIKLNQLIARAVNSCSVNIAFPRHVTIVRSYIGIRESHQPKRFENYKYLYIIRKMLTSDVKY